MKTIYFLKEDRFKEWSETVGGLDEAIEFLAEKARISPHTLRNLVKGHAQPGPRSRLLMSMITGIKESELFVEISA